MLFDLILFHFVSFSISFFFLFYQVMLFVGKAGGMYLLNTDYFILKLFCHRAAVRAEIISEHDNTITVSEVSHIRP